MEQDVYPTTIYLRHCCSFLYIVLCSHFALSNGLAIVCIVKNALLQTHICVLVHYYLCMYMYMRPFQSLCYMVKQVFFASSLGQGSSIFLHPAEMSVCASYCSFVLLCTYMLFSRCIGIRILIYC